MNYLKSKIKNPQLNSTRYPHSSYLPLFSQVAAQENSTHATPRAC